MQYHRLVQTFICLYKGRWRRVSKSAVSQTGVNIHVFIRAGGKKRVRSITDWYKYSDSLYKGTGQ